MSEIQYGVMDVNYSPDPGLSILSNGRHVGCLFFEERKIDFLRNIEGVALRQEIYYYDFDNSDDLVAEINRVAGCFAEVARYYWLGVAAEMDARAKANVAAA